MVDRTQKNTSSEDGEKSHMGGHDMVRRVDGQVEVLIWCRRWSVYERHRMGPKLMDCGKKKDGKMFKRILILEEEKVPAKNARGWTEGQKRRVT